MAIDEHEARDRRSDGPRHAAEGRHERHQRCAQFSSTVGVTVLPAGLAENGFVFVVAPF